jgi:hypothetical protein
MSDQAEQTNQSDKTDQPEGVSQGDEQDTEGHSLLMYEQARALQRDRERDMQKHLRDARLKEDGKNQKR